MLLLVDDPAHRTVLTMRYFHDREYIFEVIFPFPFNLGDMNTVKNAWTCILNFVEGKPQNTARELESQSQLHGEGCQSAVCIMQSTRCTLEIGSV